MGDGHLSWTALARGLKRPTHAPGPR